MLAFQKTDAVSGLSCMEVLPPMIERAGQVIIEVEAVGICGSDVHAYEWTGGYEFLQSHFPRTLGHEFSGRIIAVGKDVLTPRLGDRVTVWPAVHCGRCVSCASARSDFCSRRSIIGFHLDGAFASQVVVPAANCFVLPDGVDAELGALTEPLCVSANAVSIGEIGIGDSVVVMGTGPIGVGAAWLARKAGASSIVLVGKDDQVRLGLAARLGIGNIVDLQHQELPEYAASLGRPVDVVIEATGAPESVGAGLSILRPGGIFVATGIHARPVQFDLTRFVRSGQQLRAAYDSTRPTWERVLSVVAQSPEEIRGMITHRLPLEKANEGFEIASSRQALKVILFPNQGRL